MKIVYVLPGFGGSFYCQNCFRDNMMLKPLRALGHEVFMAPMYMPLSSEGKLESTVFYGAINVYLREQFKALRHMPAWLERFFNAPFFMRIAMSMAGSTRATGLEEMTLSVLKGEYGNQSQDLAELVGWIRNIDPDIVHISNALLLGLAPQIRRETNAKVICTLQDEDTWVDVMRPPMAAAIWNEMRSSAEHVDSFISVSSYYARKMMKKLSVPAKKMHVVPPGVATEGFDDVELPMNPPVIGFLSRLSVTLGLDTVINAFLKLKADAKYRNLRLRLSGGKTNDDNKFLKETAAMLERKDLAGDVDIVPEEFAHGRMKFLRSLTVLTVPVPGGEAFGTYQIEAMAAGVPVVQPDEGAYPEVIRATGGGVIYGPNNADALARTIRSLLDNPRRLRVLGMCGQRAVRKNYSADAVVKKIETVYECVLGRRHRER
ncbi:MAG: glycosyltransferase family 4 protein [Spirochaetes bacterium]|nr:glycosyltransferase family 4 protein [Spirochaetota bacterium]